MSEDTPNYNFATMVHGSHAQPDPPLLGGVNLSRCRDLAWDTRSYKTVEATKELRSETGEMMLDMIAELILLRNTRVMLQVHSDQLALNYKTCRTALEKILDVAPTLFVSDSVTDEVVGVINKALGK